MTHKDKRNATSFGGSRDINRNGVSRPHVPRLNKMVTKFEGELIKLDEEIKVMTKKNEALDPEKPLPDFDYTNAMQGWIQKRYLDILQNLYDIMRYEDSSPTARVASAKILLDRGFGQVPQTLNLKTEEKTTYSLIAQKPDGSTEVIANASANKIGKIGE